MDMDKGSKVYRAYISDWEDRFSSWIDTGVVSGIVQDGVPFVSLHGTLTPLTDSWRSSEQEAKRDIHARLIRYIGRMQAKADAMIDEILHDDLTTEAA